MANAVIYTRVSTQEQAADNHHSLAAQLHLCQKAAQERGYQVVAHFEDAGKSATSMKRPGLQDLLVYCEQHPAVEAIFVQDTDRLARNTQDHLALRALFSKQKIKLISVSQPMVEDSAEGNLIDTIIASVNQFQSDLTARKVLKGMEEKVRGGGWPGKAPPGYRNVVVDRKHVVRPDTKTAPAVREIFRFYATGLYTFADLSDRLAAGGIRTITGRSLAPDHVRKMLQNPFYVGKIRWGTLQADGSHPPLVSPALFAEVQQRVALRAHIKTKAHVHTFLLRGLLSCAGCGRQLVGEVHPKKGKTYYRCHSGLRCGPCLSKPRAEERLQEIVNSLKFSEEDLESIYLDLVKMSERAQAESITQEAAALNRQKGLSARQRTLDEKLLAGTIRDQEYRRIQDQFLQELQSLEDQLVRVERLRRPRLDLFEQMSDMVLNLPGLYFDGTDEQKRLYLTMFWTGFTVEAGELTPKPTDLLAGLITAQQSLPQAAGASQGRIEVPPTAPPLPVIHGSSKTSRQGEPDGRTSNLLFRLLTDDSAALSAHLAQLVHAKHRTPQDSIESQGSSTALPQPFAKPF